MKYPEGYTEEEVLAEIIRVANLVVKDVTVFGYYSKEDLRQQAMLFAIESLEKGSFDPTKSLGAYLRTCIINKFISLHRDKVWRATSPCKSCVFYDKDNKVSTNQCSAFKDKMECKKWKRYYNRNKSKQDLMNLKADHTIFDSKLSFECQDLKQMENKDFIDAVKKRLPITYRKWIQKLIEGDTIPANQMEKLKKKIAIILAEGDRL